MCDSEMSASVVPVLAAATAVPELAIQQQQRQQMELPYGVSAGLMASSAVGGGLVAAVAATGHSSGINVDELIRENMALREKLKEVTSDRDRLLCEVANLRLELDMAELKRLPEER